MNNASFNHFMCVRLSLITRISSILFKFALLMWGFHFKPGRLIYINVLFEFVRNTNRNILISPKNGNILCACVEHWFARFCRVHGFVEITIRGELNVSWILICVFLFWETGVDHWCACVEFWFVFSFFFFLATQNNYFGHTDGPHTLYTNIVSRVEF